MKALKLARILLLYPEANVLIDTLGDMKLNHDLKTKPYREVEIIPSGEASELQVTLVVSDLGYGRARR